MIKDKAEKRESYHFVKITDATDEELALYAQKGCRESFAELVRRFGGRLLVFMQHKTGNLHDAEDLVQDTFVKAYRYIQSYQSSFKFSTWLFTIARSLTVDYYHRQKTLRIVEVNPACQSSPYLSAEEQLPKSIWALADKLTRNQYQALWLKYSENMSIKEISRIMGKSQVNVKVLLYRARKNMAEQLKNSAMYDEIMELSSQRQKLPPVES
ncbi:RNA polymerase sigma factor [Planctomycetota bacterium]